MASIQEIRQQYPQYNDMSDDALADAMHKKFYADMPRDQFNEKIGYKPVESAATPQQSSLSSRYLKAQTDFYGGIGSEIGSQFMSGARKVGAGLNPWSSERRAAIERSSKQPFFSLEPAKEAGELFGSGLSGLSQMATSPITGAVRAIGAPAIQSIDVPLRAGTRAIFGPEAKVPPPLTHEQAAGTAESLMGGVAPRGGALPMRPPVQPSPPPGASDIMTALQRDKMTPAGATQAGQEVATERPGMQTLANVGGENVRGMVERVAQTPGAGRTELVPKLIEQQQAQAERLGNDLKNLTGTSKTAVKAIDDSISAQRANAHPAYKAAYESGDRVIWDKELERLAGAKDVRDAMGEAVTGWERTAVADGYGAMNPRAMVKDGMVDFKKGGIPAYPNLQFWDYTKHALDRMIQAERDASTGRMSRKGAELTTIKNKLVGVLDRTVPEYANARAQYAGPAQYMDAIREGKELTKRSMTSEEVVNMMKGFSEAEREAYRTGVVSDLIQKMKANPGKLADYTRLLRSEDMREKIAAIMPNPELAAKWQKRLDFEVRTSEMVQRALTGPATARRLAEMQDATMMGDMITDIIKTRGSPSALAMRAVSAIPKYVRDKYRANADERIARILTSPGSLEHLELTLKGGMAQRDRRPRYGLGAIPASRLGQLQDNARDALRDKNKNLTTDQRQSLRATSRGTATIEQRKKADRIISTPSYGGPDR